MPCDCLADHIVIFSGPDKVLYQIVLKKHLHAEAGMVKLTVIVAVEYLQLLKPADVMEQGDQKRQLMVFLRQLLISV